MLTSKVSQDEFPAKRYSKWPTVVTLALITASPTMKEQDVIETVKRNIKSKGHPEQLYQELFFGWVILPIILIRNA